jgi:hypothetical protein
MIANLRFSLPEEEYEFRAAVASREAVRALAEIDEFCRQKLKYCETSETEERLLREIRSMISPEIDAIIHG